MVVNPGLVSNLSDLENEAVDLMTSKDSLWLYNSRTVLFPLNSEAPPHIISVSQTASPDSPIPNSTSRRAHTPQCAYMHVCIWFIHSDSVIHLGTNRGIMKSSKNSNWIDLRTIAQPHGTRVRKTWRLLRELPHTTVKKNGYVYSKRLLPREQKATRSWEAENGLT